MAVINKKKLALLLILAFCAAVVGVALALRFAVAPSTDSAKDSSEESLNQIFGSADVQDAAEVIAVREATTETLSGQVVLPTGEPAPGARVTATRLGDDKSIELLADTGGMFMSETLATGLYALEASLDGYGPAIIVGVRPGTEPVRLVLQSGEDLEGMVSIGDAPVPHAVVHLGGPGVFPQRSVIADAAGKYRFSGLRPGNYEVVSTGTDVGSGFGGRVSLDGDTAADNEPLDLIAYQAPRTILEVSDTATKRPVVLAVATISEGPLHVVSLHAIVQNGVAIVNFLPEGEYFLRIRSPGYLPWEGILKIDAQNAVRPIALSAGATIRGTTRDLVGNPLSGVEITAVVETPDGQRWELTHSIFDDFHRLARPDGSSYWWPSMGFESREDGTFEITGLPAGTARVIATAPGRAMAIGPALTLSPNAVYEPLNLVLEEGRRLRGRVEDSTGGPVDGALIHARHPDAPEWLAPEAVVSPRNGTFDLRDLPENVVITARHQDFAQTTLQLQIPVVGLDNFVIRLSGSQTSEYRGRVFAPGGAPAVGANVWLLTGNSALPACRATVGADAWFVATNCTAMAERIAISLPGAAPLLAELASQDARDWHLAVGGEMAVIAQREPLVARIVPAFQLPSALWQPPQISLDRWSRQIVQHLAPGEYDVTCAAPGHADASVQVTVEDGKRVEAECPTLKRLVSFPVYVIDQQGAPVSGALVLVDGAKAPIRALTGPDGKVDVEVEPGQWLTVEAMHDQWGRGALDVYSPFQPRSEPYRVELNFSIAGADPEAFLANLADWGVDGAMDGRAIKVASVRSGSPVDGLGLRPLDSILWAKPAGNYRFSIGIRRGAEILTFEAVRRP